PEAAKPILERLSYDPRHEKALRFLLADAYELDGKLYERHWVYGGCPPRGGDQPSLAGVDELKGCVATFEIRGAELAEERARAEVTQAEATIAARAAAQRLAEESGLRHGLEARVTQLAQALENGERNVALSTEESARALA